MNNGGFHISDEDLLRALDGELSSREAAPVQAHLEECWTCRARRSELERTIEEFVKVHRQDLENDLPAIDGPRALLRARLNELQSRNSPRPLHGLLQHVSQASSAVFSIAVLAAVGCVGIVLYFSTGPVRAASVPDSTLTPGVTRTARKEEICPSRPTEGFYPIPATLAYRVFEKYGIADPKPRVYEVDYLITPALGGADDIRNLWPQPYAAGEWNAHIKDALEDHLHEQVCAEKLDLETAQRDIASNWIAAYRKYFNTNRPLQIHVAFSIDPPWED
jgi:hypothetical protein